MKWNIDSCSRVRGDVLRYEGQGEELTQRPDDQITLWPLRLMISSGGRLPGSRSRATANLSLLNLEIRSTVVGLRGDQVKTIDDMA